jgi:hypothetical protein
MTAQPSPTRSFHRAATGALALLALATATLASAGPAQANWRSEYGWGIAGVAAGALALGAIAEANRQPAYVDEQADDCYQVRRKVWTGTAWRIERRTVCE